MGWFDRYCITLKALPIFPVTFCRRRTDRGKLPPPPHSSQPSALCLLSPTLIRRIYPRFSTFQRCKPAMPRFLSLCLRRHRPQSWEFLLESCTLLDDTSHLFVVLVMTRPAALRTSCRDFPTDWEASLVGKTFPSTLAAVKTKSSQKKFLVLL